jgi:hypothetical protein
MENPVLQEELLTSASETLNLERNLVWREIEKRATRPSTYRPRTDSTVARKKKKTVEKELYLLLLLLNNPDLLPLATSRVDESYFQGRWTRRLWQLLEGLKSSDHWDASTVFDMLENHEFEAFFSGKLMDEVLSHNPRE